MKQEIALEEMTRRGAMTKSPADMSAQEFQQWESERQLKARAYLFSIDQPVVTRLDGQIIAEYADGSVREIR